MDLPADLETACRAAARLGHPDALNEALDALARLSPIAANAPLGEGDVDRVLLPLGEALAGPAVAVAHLRDLQKAPLAALRAVAAVALAVRYLRGQPAGARDLARSAKDARAEVRWALQKALRRHAQVNPQRLLDLLSDWLTVVHPPRSPRQVAVALHTLPVLAVTFPDEVLPLAAAQRDAEHPEAQKALAACLRELAQEGLAPAVLDLLRRWAEAPAPPLFVIGRTLSGRWAQAYRAQAEAILDLLEARYGPRRPLTNARKALKTTEDTEGHRRHR